MWVAAEAATTRLVSDCSVSITKRPGKVLLIHETLEVRSALA
jgi:hypothetical protein